MKHVFYQNTLGGSSFKNIATGETSHVISSLTIMTFITRLLLSLDKEAAAFEAPGQTKEDNDTSRHPKVFKVGPKLGYQ